MDSVKFLQDIQSVFRAKSIKEVIVVSLSLIAVCVTVVSAFSFVQKNKQFVYVISDGQALEASRAKNDVQIDLEIMDHVAHFHELFFNLAPNAVIIDQNLNKACELADNSAEKFISDLKEQRFYTDMIQNNISQELYVDSVKVNINVYPYLAQVYSTRYWRRESNITEYKMITTCKLTEVERTQFNPHGLMIEDFQMVQQKKVETRKR